MDKYNGIVSTSTKTPVPNNTKYICLLRYRAELYLYYNTAEITTMNLNPYDKVFEPFCVGVTVLRRALDHVDLVSH